MSVYLFLFLFIFYLWCLCCVVLCCVVCLFVYLFVFVCLHFSGICFLYLPVGYLLVFFVRSFVRLFVCLFVFNDVCSLSFFFARSHTLCTCMIMGCVSFPFLFVSS